MMMENRSLLRRWREGVKLREELKILTLLKYVDNRPAQVRQEASDELSCNAL